MLIEITVRNIRPEWIRQNHFKIDKKMTPETQIEMLNL